MCRAWGLAALLLTCAPAAASAQTAPPVFFAGGLNDGITRLTAEAGVLVPFQVSDRGIKGEFGQNGKFVDCVCLEAAAGLGNGGARLAIGPALEDATIPFLPLAADALLTFTRTFDSPGGARPNATYVGVEGGILIMGFRVRVGFAHAVSGSGPQGTVVTGNVGFRLQW
jgi:hypothetical protein